VAPALRAQLKKRIADRTKEDNLEYDILQIFYVVENFLLSTIRRVERRKRCREIKIYFGSAVGFRG
jgi:hypothetical protein